MLKKLFLLIFLIGSLTGVSQRFKTSQSYIKFYSDAPMEDIEAINESATSLIDLSNNAIVIVVPIKAFSFQKKLMQQHFNENYLESDQFPNATFKGKIVDWDGEYGESKATATGTLELHGVTRNVSISGEISFKENQIYLSTVFPVRLADYNIKIPKAVFYNIAEEVEVTAKLEYAPYEKN